MFSTRFFLRIEALVWFVLSLCFYEYVNGSWWLFLILFFVPDLSILGYLMGPKRGALIYNIAHAQVWGAILLSIGVIFRHPISFHCGLIWLSHIFFDRMLGIGLKHDDGFKNTHLGKIKLPT